MNRSHSLFFSLDILLLPELCFLPSRSCVCQTLPSIIFCISSFALKGFAVTSRAGKF